MTRTLVFEHHPFSGQGLPKGWARATVGEIAKSVVPGFPSGEHNQDKRGVPHIRPMNIDREGRLDLSTLKYVEGEISAELARGDVVFNNTNSPELIGKTTSVDIDAQLAYSNHMTRIRLENGLRPAFVARQLHYLWMSGYFRHRCVNHVNQASISAEPLSTTVPVWIAPFAEQARITGLLDELLSDLDAGLNALERVRAKLSLYRASVLRAAIEGALTEEWRAQHTNVEPASELLERILVERRRRWEDHELAKFKRKGQEPPKNWNARYVEPVALDTTKLPPLPSRWCWATWGQVGVSKNGRAFPSRDYRPSGIKLLRPGNLNAAGDVKWTDRNTRFVSDAYVETASDLVVGGNELVMNLTAQSLKDDFLGRVCITAVDERCLLNQRLALLSPILVPRRFMLWLFKSSVFRAFVAELNTGSLIQHMFTSQLDRFVLPLPPLKEQEAIAEVVDDHLSVIDHLEADVSASVNAASYLRSAILRRAFMGGLVPQDPDDEPASELLKRIASERAARANSASPRRPRGRGKIRPNETGPVG